MPAHIQLHGMTGSPQTICIQSHGCNTWKQPLFMSAFDILMVSMHSIIWRSDCFPASKPQCLCFLQHNPVNICTSFFPMAQQCLTFFFFFFKEYLKPVKLSVLTVLFSSIIQSLFHSHHLNVIAISNAVTSRTQLLHTFCWQLGHGWGGQKGKHTWTHLVHCQTKSTCAHRLRKVW